MIIEVDENSRVQDIEEAFSLFYPYLKLELEPVGGLEAVRKACAVEIRSDMTIADVRRIFSDDLQMFSRLSRRQNQHWVSISEDELLTLKQENDLGRAESESISETQYEDFFETEY